MNNKFLSFLLLLTLVFFVGCSQTIEEVKVEKNIGEKVSVSGTVEGTIKLGELSAYTIVDENGDKIAVASKNLPNEGDEVTAKGILEKKSIIGYYINSDK